MSPARVVRTRNQTLVLPTYLPAAPDRNPMFLEHRVYQGSSGRIYPLPFTDRIASRPTPRAWRVVWLENTFLRVMLLPEAGGRIHAIYDRTNGYHLIYFQPVIKPALVGLAGPWLSGGIEFNWPQHHRPATFLPVDVHVQADADGSKTVWCSDHDPMARMKGMHGVCLRPGRAYVELKVRAYNRTPFVQTFLWWANVGVRVHEGYQSFFPPDVTHVADHARRAVSEYPRCHGRYYGVDYAARARRGILPDEVPARFVPPHCRTSSAARGATPAPPLPHYSPNDLSFYANIPVPTSYMALGSREDFCGGYDHFAQAGVVLLANHHIAPGKKQWTWGNHDFGYAWDRNLTEPDADGEHLPYIELMTGVFTDNQPDFSFLQPGETRTWTQYWYPLQKIGPAHHASLDAAVHLKLGSQRFRVGVNVTRAFPRGVIRLERPGGAAEWDADLAPGKPFVLDSAQAPKPWTDRTTTLRVLDRHRNQIIAYTPRPIPTRRPPPPATEPPPPRAVASADELFLTGLHLEQYRHATRSPTIYWREALRRDPFDSRCNNAMGLWHLGRGEFADAEAHFRNAITRLTQRNPNPYDGEAYYHLGLCLRFQLGAGNRDEPSASRERFDEAYAAFYKATWNQAWAAPAFHGLAEMDCRLGNWTAALEHLERSLRLDADNTRARDLKVLVLRRLASLRASRRSKPSSRDRDGQPTALSLQAAALLRETLALDPLDWWARHLTGEPVTCDLQTRLDIAHDLAHAGFYREAIALLEVTTGARTPGSGSATRKDALPDQSWGAVPLLLYTLGWLHEQLAAPGPRAADGVATNRPPQPLKAALAHYRHAAAAPPDYCFPARLEEIPILQAAIHARPRDARAPYYLGNLLYDRRRHREAIRCWEQSAKLDPDYSVVWRNLGIGYFNILKQPARARAAYERAIHANPRDPRLLYERDQLWKRLGEPPRKRLRELERRLGLVRRRDDLTLELCVLYNRLGQPAKALQVLGRRRFQPWEGGEGGPLGQHVRAHLALGRAALAHGKPTAARNHFTEALACPANLGEAGHLLANQSEIHYWLGVAHAALGDAPAARRHWTIAAAFKGDFRDMRVRRFSEMTLYSAVAVQRLGRRSDAKRRLRGLLAHARRLQRAEAKIDYFATSLPAMLPFDDDLQARQETTALFLQAQALLGLGKRRQGRRLLAQVLARDPNHALAAELCEPAAQPGN